MHATSHPQDRIAPDSLERHVQQALIAGVACVLLFPFARVETASIGWLPLWLVGLPLAAWLGLRLGRRLDRQPAAMSMASMPASATARARRRRGTAQARRRPGLRSQPMPVQQARPPA